MAYVGGDVLGAFLGDAAADAVLATPLYQQRLKDAQAAAAKLPADYTMGDPTSDQYGKAFYKGWAIIGKVSDSSSPTGAYWQLQSDSGIPWNALPADPVTEQLIADAAQAAYAVYAKISQLRGASPDMFAVLSDPEWIALEGQSPEWDKLSPALQAKIKAVPILYDQFTNQAAFQADVERQTAERAAAAVLTPKPPGQYTADGITFLDDGTVLSVDGQPVTGKLTPEEVSSLIKTGHLPSGDSGPRPPAPPPPPPPPPPAAPTPQPAPVSTAPVSPTAPVPSASVTYPSVTSGSSTVPAAPMPTAPAPAIVSSSGLSAKTGILVGIGVLGIGLVMALARPSGTRPPRHRR